MALPKDEVIKIANGFIERIRKKHDVRQVYLFGSFATDMAKDYSDADVAIVLGSLASSEESPFGEDFEIFHETYGHSRWFFSQYMASDIDQGPVVLWIT